MATNPPADSNDTGVGKGSRRLTKSIVILKRFVEQHGMESLNRKTRVDGFHLGHWVTMRRNEHKHGMLPDWLRAELEALPGWSWDPVVDRYREYLDLLRQYAEHTSIDRLTTKTEIDGRRLGVWVTCRRVDHRKGTLPQWVRVELEAIPGWTWDPLTERQQRNLRLLKNLVAEKGWEQFTTRTHVDGINLGGWVNSRRMDYRAARLSDWLKQELESIPGWQWSAKETKPDTASVGSEVSV